MLNLLFVIILLLSGFHLFRIVRGPSIWDRILGLNLFSVHMIIALVIYALMTQLDYIIDLAIVYTLLSFIGIIFISRFIQRKGGI